MTKALARVAKPERSGQVQSLVRAPRCIAAAVFNENGAALGALSLARPMARFADKRTLLLGQRVRARADAITALLGGVLPAWR